MRYTKKPKIRSMSFMATEDQYNWINDQAAKMDISAGHFIRESLERCRNNDRKGGKGTAVARKARES